MSDRAAMLDLMDNMLTHRLTEMLYPAAAARLSYRLESGERGYTVRADGFSEKLPVREAAAPVLRAWLY